MGQSQHTNQALQLSSLDASCLPIWLMIYIAVSGNGFCISGTELKSLSPYATDGLQKKKKKTHNCYLKPSPEISTCYQQENQQGFASWKL